MERIVAHYLIETPLDPRAAAEALAGEQSSGTFVAVPGETAALKARFAARVEKVAPLETVPTPSLPGARGGAGSYHRAEIAVSWSTENFGTNLSTVVSALQGNLYELAQFSGLRLLDFEVPAGFAEAFRGPKFGVEGCRRLTGVTGRPLIGTIIKPSIGLSPAQTAELVRTLVEAGIDFIKDDELMADPPHSPFDARVDAVMRVINAHAERTGRKAMYAFNVSGEADAMQRHYDKIVAAGGTCAMLSLNSVGLAAAKKICDLGALAIHGHRNGWGMLNRHPRLGMEFAAYQKLWRLAGVDQLHVNGLANKFWEPDASVVRSIAACLAPLRALSRVLPVVSSGQWGGQAPETWRRTHTTDLLYLAGGGILAHPAGAVAGVRSLQRWWEAASHGLSPEKAVKKYPELAVSVRKFGSKPKTALRFAFYADDFTGSTDALESLTRAGLKTVLFTAPPTAKLLRRFSSAQAIGVAGTTRSLAPVEMEPELRDAFRLLRKLDAPHVHYKVCSTFDSSPTVGSIGRAIEVGADVFQSKFVPVVVGAPALGRYVVFGNLFARMGIGSAGEIHRLDRHPAMSRHPVTPADEADLRLHLGRQTAKRIGLVDLLKVSGPTDGMRAELDAQVKAGAEVILFDVFDHEQLGRIGALLDEYGTDEAPLFSVGSSGVESALGSHWNGQRICEPVSSWPTPGPASPLLVVSGSCSPVTAKQIAWAEVSDFAIVPLAASAIVAQSATACESALRATIEHLRAGRHVVLCTSRGETDPAMLALTAAKRGALGTTVGRIAREAIAATGVRRLLVTGGDTAGYAAATLGIEALEMIAPLAPGAPLCRAYAPGSPLDGCEVNFKGGQVGAADYFGAVARGHL